MKASPFPLVVLVHGLHSTQEELVFIRAGLQRAGIECHLPKIAGYTFDKHSHRTPTSPNWHTWVAQLVAEIHELKKRHGPVVLTGVSVGANLVIAAALEVPDDVAGVAPLSTPLFIDGWNIPFYSPLVLLAYYTPLGALWTYKESPPFGVKDERIRQWTARELAFKGTSATGSSSIPNTHLRESHRLQRWLRQQLKTNSPHLPMLAVHARHDDIASLKNVRYLSRNWPKEYFNQLILEDSYHMVSVDHERGKVTQALVQFIQRFTRSPSSAK